MKTEFADPETRGKLRAWKQELDIHYKNFIRSGPPTKYEALEFCKRSARVGRQRIFGRVQQRMQAFGAVLWGLCLDGPHPLALWVILKPRNAVSVENDDPAYQQNCVTADYILFGSLPDGSVGMQTGLWTIEVPDHALGRVMQRSTHSPDAIILAAHQTLLRLRHDQVIPNNKPNSEWRQFLIRSGPGGFVCNMRIGTDIVLPDSTGLFITARTWLSDDQLRGEQIILAEDGEVGDRLGDSWLMPAPLRRSELDEDGVTLRVQVWMPGLFDTIAAPKGHA